MTLEQGGGADRSSIAEVLQVHRDGQRTVHPASSGRNAVCVSECARVDHCGNLVFLFPNLFTHWWFNIAMEIAQLQMICLCTMVIFYSYVNLLESNFFLETGTPFLMANSALRCPWHKSLTWHLAELILFGRFLSVKTCKAIAIAIYSPVWVNYGF